ncbi:MAG: AsmA family protein, partial [bacterium]|nr:AsmA family protein [bacterium]
MLKKIVKILLYTTVILLTLLLTTALVFRQLFPTEKLKRIATAQLGAELSRKIEIGDVWLNPFRGFRLDNVRVFENPLLVRDIGDSSWFFKVDQIQLNYHLLKLIRKQVHINQISIKNPTINLIQFEDRQWNFEDLIAPEDSALVAVEDTLVMDFSLPLSIKVDKFSLENIIVNLQMKPVEMKLSLNSGGLTIKLDEFYLPGNDFENIQQTVTANLQLLSTDLPWRLSWVSAESGENVTAETTLQLAIFCQVKGLGELSGRADIALADFKMSSSPDGLQQTREKKFPLPRLVSLAFEIAANLEQEELELHNFELTLADQKLFKIIGKAEQLLKAPQLDLEIIESDIRLDKLLQAALPVLPDSVQQQLDGVEIVGQVSLAGTKIKGSPLAQNIEDALAFQLWLSASNIGASISEPASFISNASLTIASSGFYFLDELYQADFQANLSIDEIFTTVDTLEYSLKGIRSTVNGELSADFFPEKAQANLNIENFFNSPLNFELDYQAIERLERYLLTGNLNFK